MLFADENSSVFTYLVGAIVLVMTAVGLSLMIDKRFQFSSGLEVMTREIELGEVEIAELSADLGSQSQQLRNSEKERGRDASEHREATAAQQLLNQRSEELKQARTNLKTTYTSLGEQFSRVRLEYRNKTRAAAIGEKLADLQASGGRIFRQVTISKVTDVGIEFRHELGIARIQAPDLDPKWQDRFQWDDEERRSRLKEEQENRDGKSQEVTGSNLFQPASGNAIESQSAIDPARQNVESDDTENLLALRTQVSARRRKVNSLRDEIQQTESARYISRNKSVPGSLETWAAKTGRLDVAVAKARSGLELAKAQLAAIAPSDSLLGPEYMD